MNDQAKIQRTLRLLMLLAGKRWYSPQEINHRIGISTRTLYRYLQTLEKAGFVVERSTNGYRLAAEKGSMLTIKRLLHFTEEEAVLLYRTLGMLHGESPSKERLIRKLHTLYDCHLLAQAQKQHTLEIVATLQKACDKKQQVVLNNYRSSNSQTIANRVVEAYAFTELYDAVWAYDIEDATCKQFKLARMDSATLALHGWQHEADHAIAFTDVFGMAAPKQKGIARLHLTMRAANLLTEEHPGSEKYINPAKTGFEAHLPYADYKGIGRFIKGLPQEIEVLGPAGLKKFLGMTEIVV
jgi:proteasome accessory factor C